MFFKLKKNIDNNEEIITSPKEVKKSIVEKSDELKFVDNINYELPDINMIEDNIIRDFIMDNCSCGKLMIPLGLENNNLYKESLESMPNLIVGGTVMSGKSSFIHTLIGIILLCKKPYETKLLLYYSKMVEYSQYNDIPHLLCPVITSFKMIEYALKRMIEEINERLELLNKSNQKNITEYNNSCDNVKNRIPSYVVIIDDYDVLGSPSMDDTIMFIAKNGWLVNVYLIIVSNRPSSIIMSSTSKSYFPARLCFKVTSSTDSKIIIDDTGASKLSGVGSALYKSRYVGDPKKISVHIIDDNDLNYLINHSIKQQKANYLEKWVNLIPKINNCETNFDYDDDLYNDVVEFVVSTQKASASLIQRKFKVNYNRAARLIDILEERGIIGPQNGSKPREVLVQLNNLKQ